MRLRCGVGKGKRREEKTTVVSSTRTHAHTRVGMPHRQIVRDAPIDIRQYLSKPRRRRLRLSVMTLHKMDDADFFKPPPFADAAKFQLIHPRDVLRKDTADKPDIMPSY
ncbi:hypothetical protein J6590_061887 [Homalodisca vitripennis]|nr:hypothetical protein J6590_061887 [Homalodisca vitripennis]